MGPGLQEWIHRLEVAEGARLIKLIAAWLSLIALLVVYDLREFRNLDTQEAMDAAQVARNLTEGRGFTTKFIRPLSLHLTQERVTDKLAALPPDAPKEEHDRLRDLTRLKTAHPDLANPPVYPGLLAGLMKVVPFDFKIPEGEQFWRYQPDFLIGCFNQCWFVVALVLAFFLAWRLFDESVAWVTALIMAGSDLLWRFSVSGLPTLLLMVILLGVVWCLVLMERAAEAEEPRRESWFVLMAAVTGALVGLGGLTRYAFAWLIVPVLAFFALYFGQRRLRLGGAALLACLIVMTQWCLRNYDVSGTLFGTAGFALQEDTFRFPDNRLVRSLSPDVGVIDVDDYFRKFAVNLGGLIREDFPKFGGSWVSSFFLVGLLVPFISQTLSRLRVFLLLSLAVLTVVQALGRTHLSADHPEVNSENLLVLLVPLVFAYGVSLYFLLLDQVRLPFPDLNRLVTGAFVLVACAPLLVTLLPPRSQPVAYPPYYPPLAQQVAGWMQEDELMMSDMPWAVAWYGDRACLWVTLGYGEGSDFFAVNDYQKPIKALYLTPLTTNARFVSQMVKGQEFAWGRFLLDSLMRTNVPSGFPLKEAPRGFLPDHLFLTDWQRWRGKEE